MCRAAARSGKKVLHLDFNDYYGGYAASNTLSGFEKVLTSTSEGINSNENTSIHLNFFHCNL